ncbi:MAG: enoyl-CoA hydratase/isomerase family protein [Planctomycetota bacterium]|nr:enoyl-CoA hydratase/isomerase family protein [Planctomycetota bacterium]
MSREPVVTSQDGALATLRIQRPESENRLNLEVLKRLTSALRAADADDTVRAVALTGTGDTFCCGGDIDEIAVGDQASYRTFGEWFGALHGTLLGLSKPVIGAVNGDALAGGLSLLSVCDVAVARRSARYAMPEILAGLWPVMAMVSLNRVLPRKRAFELYYFGESFGAPEALELGLINWAVDDDEFEEAVRDRGRRLAELPRSAVRIGRPTVAELADRNYADGFAWSAERLVELLMDPEVSAALARRKDTP